MTEKVILICQDCHARNYHISRSKNSKQRLILKKYCRHCKKVTIHQETR
ncbi:MAG: 50S ribosomal protein L33 [Mycoplasmataceae bacterium]|nr:50S ribosomal protein L33 [Mycoplasmataceae bacterium]